MCAVGKEYPMHRLRLVSVICTSGAVALFAGSTFGRIPESIIERFENASNVRTPIGVTDGNPLAATAVFSNSLYRRFGFDYDRPDHFGVDFGGSYGAFSSGSIDDAHFATMDLTFNFAIGDRVSLLATLPIGYRDTYGAKTYVVAAGLGMPITLSDNDPNWTLSPWGLIGVADGSDLAQGGIQYGVGATHVLRFPIGGPFYLGMANQIGYFTGEPFGYSDAFEFEQNVSQFILKNGFELEARLSERFDIYASIIYSNFLKDAFVDNYLTPEAGVRFKGDHFGASLALFGDTGQHYDGLGVRANASLRW